MDKDVILTCACGGRVHDSGEGMATGDLSRKLCTLTSVDQSLKR